MVIVLRKNIASSAAGGSVEYKRDLSESNLALVLVLEQENRVNRRKPFLN